MYINNISRNYNSIFYKKVNSLKKFRKKKKISFLFYSYKEKGLKIYSFTGYVVSSKENGFRSSVILSSNVDNFFFSKQFLVCAPYIVDYKIYNVV